jgi:hypothetical protein
MEEQGLLSLLPSERQAEGEGTKAHVGRELESCGRHRHRPITSEMQKRFTRVSHRYYGSLDSFFLGQDFLNFSKIPVLLVTTGELQYQNNFFNIHIICLNFKNFD